MAAPAAATGKTATLGRQTPTGAKPNGTAEQKAAAAKLAAAKSGVAPKAATAKKGGTPVAPPTPYLTPAQSAAEQKYDTTYGYNVAGLQNKLTTAQNTEGENVANNNLAGAKSNDAANQAMAARGLFESSIRDSDLNDIASTLAMRNNILQTNLGTLTTSVNNQIGTDATQYGIQHNLFNEDAVANAQSGVPATGNTPGAGTGGTGSSGPPTAVSQSKQPNSVTPAPNSTYATSPAVAALAQAAANGKAGKPPKPSASSSAGNSASGGVTLPSAPSGMGA